MVVSQNKFLPFNGEFLKRKLSLIVSGCIPKVEVDGFKSRVNGHQTVSKMLNVVGRNTKLAIDSFRSDEKSALGRERGQSSLRSAEEAVDVRVSQWSE